MRTIDAIINPRSGAGRAARHWPAVARRLGSAGLRVVEHATRGRGHAIELAAKLAAGGSEELLVVGGDGTVNEVVNGIFSLGGEPAQRAIVNPMPCGTGRDFCRSLGIDSQQAAARALLHGRPTAIDVGVIRYHDNGAPATRYFVNAADAGFGATTAAWVNRTTRSLGFLAYAVGATRTILFAGRRSLRIVVDGQIVHDGPAGMVVLANGRYHAGGMCMAPAASMSDGRLDVLVLGDVPKWTLLGSLLPRVYWGRHLDHPAVKYLQGTAIQISGPQSMPFEVDGEQPGHTDLSATVLPKALRVRL